MSDPLFIDDGFSRPHDVEAVPGLHPAVSLTFRPSLDRERKVYDAHVARRDPDALEKYENDLITRQVLDINGKPPSEWKDRLSRLHPTVRAVVLNLILSFTPAKQAEAESKSSGA